EFNVPPGALLSALNCRQNRNGALSKRPGNTKLTNQYQLPEYAGAAAVDVSLGGALATHGSQLLLSCNAGTLPFSEAHGTFATARPHSEALLSRTGVPLPALIQANTSVLYSQDPIFITDGTHNFYVWIDSIKIVYLTIQNAASGTIVQDRIIIAGAGNAVWAIPLLLGTQLTITHLLSTGVLAMVTLASPYTGAVSAPTTLNTGVTTTANFDAVV